MKYENQVILMHNKNTAVIQNLVNHSTTYILLCVETFIEEIKVYETKM